MADQKPNKKTVSPEEPETSQEATQESIEETVQPTSSQTTDLSADLQTQLQRLAADYDNYRRRTEQERQNLVPMIQARTLMEIAPVLDNFKRATEHLPEDLKGNNWVTGVLYVEKQLEQVFEQFGLTRIPAQGQTFDPAKHEAISTEPSQTVENNQIIAEVEAGYMLNGQVLKPARVKVSSGETPRS